MRTFRTRPLAVFLLILAIVGVWLHLYLALEGTSDRTSFNVSPSRFYLRESLPERSSDSAGDLVLRIDGVRHTSLAETLQTLHVAPPSRPVRLELWNPPSSRSYSMDVPAREVVSRIEQMPRAVLLTRVGGRGASRGSLQVGDLIVAVNGEPLGDYEEPDPYTRLMIHMYGLFEVDLSPVMHADLFIRRNRPGDVLTYEILRGGRQQVQRVQLTRRGFRWPNGPIELLCAILLSIMCGFLVRPQPRGVLVSILIAAAYFLFFSMDRGAYGPGRALLDIGVLLPVAAAVALRPPRPPRDLRQPRIWLLALFSFAVVLALVVIGAGAPTLVPHLVAERVVAPGFVSVAIFSLLAWVFVFGLLCLASIWWNLVSPARPGSRINARLTRAVKRGSAARVLAILKKEPAAADGFYGRRIGAIRRLFARNPELVALEALGDNLIADDEEGAQHAFSVLRWCEVALPLLGFLGTVVGMASALPRMAAVIQSGPRRDIDFDALRLAFRDIGLAFDTTLVGLLGVLILGLLHSFLARRFAIQLTTGQHLLRQYASTLKPTSVVAQLVLLEASIGAVEAAALVAQEERHQLLGALELMITEGGGEPWRELRRVLNQASVSFDELGGDLWEERSRFLSSQGVDEPEIVAVTCAADSNLALALVESAGSHSLLRFEPAGRCKDLIPLPADVLESEIEQMVCSPSGRYLLISDADGGLWEVDLPSDGASANIRNLADEVNGNADEVDGNKQIWTGKLLDAEAMFVAEEQGGTCDLWCQKFGEVSSRAFLGEAEPWRSMWCHARSGTFVVFSPFDGVPILQRFELKRQTEETFELLPTGSLQLDPNTEPHHLAFLNDHEVVLVLIESQLQKCVLYDFAHTSTTPIELPPPLRIVEVQTGGRWLALRDDAGQLSMWRLMRNGHLNPVVSGDHPRYYAVPNTPAKNLVVPSGDGRYLIAAAGSSIGTWRFPRTHLDELQPGHR